MGKALVPESLRDKRAELESAMREALDCADAEKLEGAYRSYRTLDGAVYRQTLKTAAIFGLLLGAVILGAALATMGIAHRQSGLAAGGALAAAAGFVLGIRPVRKLWALIGFSRSMSDGVEPVRAKMRELRGYPEPNPAAQKVVLAVLIAASAVFWLWCASVGVDSVRSIDSTLFSVF